MRNGDLSAARALVDAGVDIDKAGDLGYAPLHVARTTGNIAMLTPQVKMGLANQDRVCDLLKPLTQVQSRYPEI